MSNFIFTIGYCFKTAICFFGYVASLMLGQPSDVLFFVTIGSALAIPFFAWMEANQ